MHSLGLAPYYIGKTVVLNLSERIPYFWIYVGIISYNILYVTLGYSWFKDFDNEPIEKW